MDVCFRVFVCTYNVYVCACASVCPVCVRVCFLYVCKFGNTRMCACVCVGMYVK